MKKLGVFITAILLSVGVAAKPVKTFDKAVDLVIKSVEKNKLTSLETNCLMFVEGEKSSVYYYVDVLEKHNDECGGDPQTAPRLFTYAVNKSKGSLKTDAIYQEQWHGKDEFYLYPIDPISPVYLYDDNGKERRLKIYRRNDDVVLENDHGITDEKVKQYILIENNSMKCFEPEFWNAKTDEERQAIIDRKDLRQQNDDYRHEMALTLEIFGEEISSGIMGTDIELQRIYNRKVEQFQNRQTTVETESDCQKLAEYRYKLLRKHYYGEIE